METDTQKVIRVDWAWTGDEKDAMNQTYDKGAEASSWEGSVFICLRARADPGSIPHQEDTMGHFTGSEYDPNLRSEPERPIKPLHVTQPEGPSFTVDGHLVQWQDWRFRIGFNFREGLTLHDISFKGRQLFYRLSFSDSKPSPTARNCEN